MIELLIATVLIGAFSTAGAVAYRSSQIKARDAERKSDLRKLQTALEDYYNDNHCYPPEAQLATCGDDELTPYLDETPCDPRTKEPYYYMPLADRCQGYRLYASLIDDGDPAIAQLGCDTEVGCGYGAEYNYGIAAGTTVVNFDLVPEPSPSPGASEEPGVSPLPSAPTYVYACDPDGVCNIYQDPVAAGCPVHFDQDSSCNDECWSMSNRCAQ